MRWVCPGCGSQVSVALSQCPNCGSSEQSAAPASAANQRGGGGVQSDAESAASYPSAPPPAERPAPAPPVAPEASGPRQRLLPTPRPAAEAAPEPENPFWRGVKFGVGFMFAVAMILLLLAMLLPWLREQGWQPWLDTTAP